MQRLEKGKVNFCPNTSSGVRRQKIGTNRKLFSLTLRALHILYDLCILCSEAPAVRSDPGYGSACAVPALRSFLLSVHIV